MQKTFIWGRVLNYENPCFLGALGIDKLLCGLRKQANKSVTPESH
jgi:hypothetical protein